MSLLFRDTSPLGRRSGVALLRLNALILAVCVQGWSGSAAAEAPASAPASAVAVRPLDGMTTPHAHDPNVLGFTPLPGISPWPINPDDPVSSVPGPEELTKNPLGFGYLLQDLSVEADRALNAKNYARAEKYYLALAKAVPTRATAFSKLCAAYEVSGELEKALRACRVAAALEGVQVADYLRLVTLTLQVKDELSPKDIEEIDAVFAHLLQFKADPIAVARLKCDVATRLKDEQRLNDCVAVLTARGPDAASTLSYQWSLAVLRKDWNQASRLVERARALKLPPAAIHSMVQGTAALKQQDNRSHLLLAGLAFGVLALLALAVGLGRSTKRRRLSEGAGNPAASGA
jgi:hypothetical protein